MSSRESHTDPSRAASPIATPAPGTVPPAVFTTRATLWAALAAWRRSGQRVALVPTMGNLHAGHLSLVRLARQQAEQVVVSIFVNPTQFGPNEDFNRYPRTLDADLEQLSSANTAAPTPTPAGNVHVFAPGADQVYPHGLGDLMQLSAPRTLSQTLCGLARPGHFDGVVTVVSRLFNLVRPDYAVFGEKDYQQLLIIEYLCRELGYPLTIVRGATLREADGLAMSSRNQYLDPEQRRRAAAIHAQLQECAHQLSAADRATRADPGYHRQLEDKARYALQTAGLQPEYFTIRRADNLQLPQAQQSVPLRVLAAARLGTTRLIDNLPVPVAGADT